MDILKLRIFESTLELEFAMVFRTGAWRLSRPTSWMVQKGNRSRTLEKLTDRAKRMVASGLNEFEARDIDGKTIGEVNLRNDPMLKWLEEANDKRTLPAHPAQAVVLNYLATSQAVTPMRTLSSISRDDVMIEIQDLPDGHPCWFYHKHRRPDRKGTSPGNPDDDQVHLIDNFSEYLLAFPDLFITAKKTGNAWRDDIKSVIGNLISLRMMHKFSVLSFHADKIQCVIRFRDEVKLAPYPRGLLCGCLPLPGRCPKDTRKILDEPASVRTPEIVVGSKASTELLKHLSDIWQDKFAKSVLVIGPPGSGKENFSLSIPYGCGRNGKRINTMSLAVGEKPDQERLLFGTVSKPGLISKSEGGAIFVDEVHYPKDKPGMRASLLRALEANEYIPLESTETKQIKNIMWIFATSLPTLGTDSISNIKPVDFWTRMTHLVKVAHPLDSEKTEFSERSSILNNLFKFFWWERVEAYFNLDPTVVFMNDTKKKEELQLPERMARRWISIFLNPVKLSEMSDRFTKEIRREYFKKGIDKLSIRGIRSIVSRLFSMQVEEVIAHGKLDSEAGGKKFSRKMLRDVIKEVSQIATLGEAR